MLIRMADLELIRSGKLSLLFGRWRNPIVVSGGTLKTAIGVLKMESVNKTSIGKITAAVAKMAGYETRARLIDELSSRDADIYRIKVKYVGNDPRITLHNHCDLTADEINQIRSKLEKIDVRSMRGPGTNELLTAIKRHPRVSAAELALKTGCEKDWLKNNVRKLKNHGLTISHEVGYKLSPRGKFFWIEVDRLAVMTGPLPSCQYR